MRANGVFYDKCKDFKESLALQLGALQTSIQYKADVANFLEPMDEELRKDILDKIACGIAQK